VASSLRTISLVLTQGQIEALRRIAQSQPRQPSLSLVAREIFDAGLRALYNDPPQPRNGQEEEAHDV